MPKKKTIFIVSIGEYSDYSDLAYFSSKKLAENYSKAYAALYDKHLDELKVEECLVDAYANAKERTCWNCVFDQVTQKVTFENESKDLANPNIKFVLNNYEWGGSRQLYVTSYVSAEHAREIGLKKLEKLEEKAG